MACKSGVLRSSTTPQIDINGEAGCSKALSFALSRARKGLVKVVNHAKAGERGGGESFPSLKRFSGAKACRLRTVLEHGNEGKGGRSAVPPKLRDHSSS